MCGTISFRPYLFFISARATAGAVLLHFAVLLGGSLLSYLYFLTNDLTHSSHPFSTFPAHFFFTLVFTLYLALSTFLFLFHIRFLFCRCTSFAFVFSNNSSAFLRFLFSSLFFGYFSSFLFHFVISRTDSCPNDFSIKSWARNHKWLMKRLSNPFQNARTANRRGWPFDRITHNFSLRFCFSSSSSFSFFFSLFFWSESKCGEVKKSYINRLNLHSNSSWLVYVPSTFQRFASDLHPRNQSELMMSYWTWTVSMLVGLLNCLLVLKRLLYVCATGIKGIKCWLKGEPLNSSLGNSMRIDCNTLCLCDWILYIVGVAIKPVIQKYACKSICLYSTTLTNHHFEASENAKKLRQTVLPLHGSTPFFS